MAVREFLFLPPIPHFLPSQCFCWENPSQKLTRWKFKEGLVTDSQLFGFKGDSSTQLAPNSDKGATCLIPSGNVLGSGACDGSQGQLFTIG